MDGAVYRVGVALHALDDPANVLGVAHEWILAPEDPWELTGYVHRGMIHRLIVAKTREVRAVSPVRDLAI